jgi:hypothetical protein
VSHVDVICPDASVPWRLLADSQLAPCGAVPQQLRAVWAGQRRHGPSGGAGAGPGQRGRRSGGGRGAVRGQDYRGRQRRKRVRARGRRRAQQGANQAGECVGVAGFMLQTRHSLLEGEQVS